MIGIIRPSLLRRASCLSFSRRNLLSLTKQGYSPIAARVGAASAATFSSTATQELFQILDREHAEELENNSLQMPQELQDLQDSLQNDWTIVDNGANVRMFRTATCGLKIQVSFHCQDSVEADDEEYEVPPFKFTVTGTKAGTSMVFVCISDNDAKEVQIQSVAISNGDVEAIHEDGINASDYQGPEFNTLADDLQDAFRAFLDEDAGVDSNVAEYISMMANFKEQSEYVAFLDVAKSLSS